MNRVWAPGAPSINRLQVLVQSHLMFAPKCISKLARSWSRSFFFSSLDHGLQMNVQTWMITDSMFSQSCHPSAPPNSLDSCFQVRTIMHSKCISKLARSLTRSASLCIFDHDLQVYLQIRSITTSKCISKLARSRSRSVSLSALDPHFQAHLELLSSSICSQSRYTECWWVAI